MNTGGTHLLSRRMQFMYRVQYLYKISQLVRKCYSIYKVKDVTIDKIRNIGILAHIDAGKTTTTERMLYFAGLINQIGEVHHGNTVTDYMEQERERGITITSAAVTLYWNVNQINLIDTPGHIDFTMEVEQTLAVLDGAVIIMDGSAGVEAQTQTVWRQADKYKIPRIVFVNKMDRADADIKMCCESLEKKLDSPCLLLQLPIREHNRLTGIIDILRMEILYFGIGKDKHIQKIPLTEKDFPKYWNKAALLRTKIVDTLTDFNDELATTVISSESLDDITSTDIIKALRTVTNSQVATPVLLGSAYKNIGVQCLMDAIVEYLPSPERKCSLYKCFEDDVCAKAFKVIHDKQKGPLVYFRLYNGLLKKNQKIYSIQHECYDQIGRIYIAYADYYHEVDNVENGNIAVVSGLQKIASGDLVTSSHSASQKGLNNIFELSKDIIPQDTSIKKLLGIGLIIPEPVFFCSIEPYSLAAQSSLEQALNQLMREDPSLRVSHNSETGQTVLAGMGELHLEIIRDRIQKEYKIGADLGNLQIVYKELPTRKITDSVMVETNIGNVKQKITLKMSLVPHDSEINVKDIMKFDRSPECASNISSIFPKHLLAVRRGIEVGLNQGPKINSQVVNTQIVLHMLEVGRGTSETMITAISTQLVQKLLRESDTDLLEPIMHLEVFTPEEYLSAVLADLSRRRTNIQNITVRGGNRLVYADVPLSELLGYSSLLRSLTSGTATFTMKFSRYQKMSPMDEVDAIRNIRGF